MKQEVIKIKEFQSKYPFKKEVVKGEILYQGPVGEIPMDIQAEVKKPSANTKFVIIYK
jgi:hypothetical protein